MEPTFILQFSLFSRKEYCQVLHFIAASISSFPSFSKGSTYSRHAYHANHTFVSLYGSAYKHLAPSINNPLVRLSLFTVSVSRSHRYIFPAIDLLPLASLSSPMQDFLTREWIPSAAIRRSPSKLRPSCNVIRAVSASTLTTLHPRCRLTPLESASFFSSRCKSTR